MTSLLSLQHSARRSLISSSSRFISSSSSSSYAATASTSTATPRASAKKQKQEPAAAAAAEPSAKTHYLVTLLRSPLHLPAPLLATCHSLGLRTRLHSSLVPIHPINAGYLLRIKELIAVRSVGMEEFAKVRSKEWREREGEGRRGSGFGEAWDGELGNGVMRIGRERCRGEERGFKVVER